MPVPCLGASKACSKSPCEKEYQITLILETLEEHKGFSHSKSQEFLNGTKGPESRLPCI